MNQLPPSSNEEGPALSQRPVWPGIGRRGFIGGVAAWLAALMTWPGPGSHASAAVQPGDRPRTKPRGAVRVAHVTDWHFMDERNAFEGMAAALDHAVSQQPALILNGGDMLTHTMRKPWAVVEPEMKKIERLFAQQRRVPTLNCPGNHDVWGWDQVKSGATGSEPAYGKGWWASHFGEGQRYRSIDLAGWHLVAIDSIQPAGDGGYKAGLDDEQFAWLQDDLGRTDPRRPVLILTHAPIVNMAVLLIDAAVRQGGGYEIGRGNICLDAWRLVDLFKKHPNVRVSLSGHMHMCDRVEFQGMSHIGGGAVCGNWWRPSNLHLTRRPADPPEMVRPQRADPGYGLIDLHPDGRFDYQYIRFPWTYVA